MTFSRHQQKRSASMWLLHLIGLWPKPRLFVVCKGIYCTTNLCEDYIKPFKKNLWNNPAFHVTSTVFFFRGSIIRTKKWFNIRRPRRRPCSIPGSSFVEPSWPTFVSRQRNADDWGTHRIHETGIFTYIWLIFMVNVGRYTIHGSYGIGGWIFVGRLVRKGF